MPLAIFGITNTALNLVVTLVVLCLVAVWLALIVFTWTDARRRISDPFLVGCATAASLFPFVGTIVYTILRPAEFLEDAHEREVEVRTAEARLRELEAHSCHKCGFPSEADFMRCPSCRTRLKEECPTCSKPVGLDWKLCPYCETALIAPTKRSSRSSSSKGESRGTRQEKAAAEPKRSGRRSAKETSGRPAAKAPAGRSTSKPASAPSGSSRPSNRSKAGDTRESPVARPASGASEETKRSDGSGQRTPRSARRKTIVPDDDGATKPINSGDPAVPARPDRSPDSR